MPPAGWSPLTGYDRREYQPFNVSFEDNQEIFEEGMKIVRRLWASDGPLSHQGRHYAVENVAITPKPVQRPLPAYVASFSQPSIELAGRLGCGLIVAPFAAAMTYGGLQQVAELYQETSARHRQRPGRLMCMNLASLALDGFVLCRAYSRFDALKRTHDNRLR